MGESPLIVSLKTSLISSLIVFFLGTLLAVKIKKLNKLRGIFDAVLTLPLVLPPSVVGLYLLIIMGKNGIGTYLSNLGISIVFSQAANVLAQTFVSLPLMYRTALGAFDQVDEELLDCARSLGASESKIFWKISMPIAKYGLFSGLILSFARSMGEFGASIMVAGNIPGKTQTISTAIYSAVQSGNKPLAIHWSLVVIGINLACMVVMNLWLSREGGKSHDRA